jgi:uncharacterized protein YxjI
MRYQIKQRLWSLAGRFDIADELGEPILEVVGKIFSIRTEFTIQSLQGAELAHIRQRLLSWLPRYDITRGGELLATMVREWTWFKPRYTIFTTGGAPLSISGSLWQHEYNFESEGRTIAQVTRPVWSLRDNYGVEVFEPKFDALVLAAVIVIDSIVASRQKSS